MRIWSLNFWFLHSIEYFDHLPKYKAHFWPTRNLECKKRDYTFSYNRLCGWQPCRIQTKIFFNRYTFRFYSKVIFAFAFAQSVELMWILLNKLCFDLNKRWYLFLRDSVTEVVACLAEYSPIIKPMSFVGQVLVQFNILFLCHPCHIQIIHHICHPSSLSSVYLKLYTFSSSSYHHDFIFSIVSVIFSLFYYSNMIFIIFTILTFNFKSLNLFSYCYSFWNVKRFLTLTFKHNFNNLYISICDFCLFVRPIITQEPLDRFT